MRLTPSYSLNTTFSFPSLVPVKTPLVTATNQGFIFEVARYLLKLLYLRLFVSTSGTNREQEAIES